MADWPDLALFKQQLGIDNDAKDELLESALASAIEGVVADCGGSPVEVSFDSGGEPTVSLVDSPADDAILIPVTAKRARAAMQCAGRLHAALAAPLGVASVFDTGGLYVARWDPIYTMLIKGGRQRFAVS